MNPSKIEDLPSWKQYEAKELKKEGYRYMALFATIDGELGPLCFFGKSEIPDYVKKFPPSDKMRVVWSFKM